MDIIFYYGEKGRGKTHYVKNAYPQAAYFCGLEKSEFKTYGVIEDKINRNKKSFDSHKNAISKKLNKFLKNKKEVIIDSAETINESEFKLLLNCCKEKLLLIIFDCNKSELFNYNNFNIIEKYICAQNIINYVSEPKQIYDFLKTKYKQINENEYSRILKITNSNFNNIDLLMCYKKFSQDNSDTIPEPIYREYVNNKIDMIFQKLENETRSILQQSSVIGESFNIDPLKDPKGFYQLNAVNNIIELEKMKIFIQSNLNKKDYFSFIDSEIHEAVYDRIASSTKAEWLQVLKNYYFSVLDKDIDIEIKLDSINRLLAINEKLNFAMESDDLITLYLNLIRIYDEMGDLSMMLEKSYELFNLIRDDEHTELKQFLFGFLIKNYINIGGFNELSYLFYGIKQYNFFDGSSLYIDFYKALTYYNCGKVEEALTIIRDLLETFKKYKSDNSEQKIHSLVYSLAATIWHHLRIDDKGSKYYKLALNISCNKLKDKSTYYSILKNCSMFHNYKFAAEHLKECYIYYEENNMKFNQGEVSLNLGTEILFNEGSADSKSYLEKADKIFSVFPNEKFAYAKNNAALYYIMVENNIEKALKKLNEALIVGLSDFTYMTIYQNICECYILMGKIESIEFNTAYDNFRKSVNALMCRDNSSRYEKIYKTILDLIIDEHLNPNNKFCKFCFDCVEQTSDEFFKEILLDIYNRNTSKTARNHSFNRFYYDIMNEKKIFLTEFRFWE